MSQSKTNRNFAIIVIVIAIAVLLTVAGINYISAGTASVQATIDAVRNATSTP